MQYSLRILGLGLLMAAIVLIFTFITALLAADLKSYNLAISAAFVMGGLLAVCLSQVMRMVNFPAKENSEETDDSK